ncbi:hypothetical protein FS320_42420 [Microvirga tunisiensis]|uniref:Uncharacterized protein n=1 Tax=Microvirga tunisiensis TaxID=2108360 RepID=A0A5N7MWK9_9HYPH|nr:hypothetical protein [Microvirga tunisiensis]MPR31355.1 hypothetical protein [Microvirga tunisiensis]
MSRGTSDFGVEAGLRAWSASAVGAAIRGAAGPSWFGRVEVWRGGGRIGLSVSAAFARRCLTGRAVAPFPHPAHRTGHAVEYG